MKRTEGVNVITEKTKKIIKPNSSVNHHNNNNNNNNNNLNYYQRYFNTYFPADEVIQFYSRFNSPHFVTRPTKESCDIDVDQLSLIQNPCSYREWSTRFIMRHSPLSSTTQLSFGFKRFSVTSAQDLRNRLVEAYASNNQEHLLACDVRYEIGPIFRKPYSQVLFDKQALENNNNNNNNTLLSGHPRQRQFVASNLKFDIDISDYITERKQCGCDERGKYSLCEKCWLILCGTCDMMDRVLAHSYHPIDPRNDITWVFTGGRGFHCWINHDVLSVSSSNARRNLLLYLKEQCQFKYFPQWQDRLKESNVSIPNQIILDENVTVDTGHLLRGIFSPHANAIPLEIPPSGNKKTPLVYKKTPISIPIYPPNRDTDLLLDRGIEYMRSVGSPNVMDLVIKNCNTSKTALENAIKRLPLSSPS